MTTQDTLTPQITGYNPQVGIPSVRNEEILRERCAAWDRIRGQRVGDYLRMPDGKLHRFSHDWGDDIQTTDGRFGASFYFGDGYMSFSGGLDPAIDKVRMRDTGELRLGSAWFFDGDLPRAHSAVYVQIPCRVYELIGGAE